MARRRTNLFKIEQALQEGAKLTFRSLGIPASNLSAIKSLNIAGKRNQEEQTPDQQRRVAKLMGTIADRSTTISSNLQSQMSLYRTQGKASFGASLPIQMHSEKAFRK